ncbi:DUF1700 domain-containing protein [Weissella bombi]|uniref:Uncharacterized membrane protein n=1 Tax=Weissella bombi TaxID=1505725 RepID=A0A1C4ACP0_9LACO|nr:DUF1700 domain-containing protein [Weissella bombi]SCB92408.1 Uncharacterized membrane protein [Weissella bombi]
MIKEYLENVRSYLKDLPTDEREELLQFYEEQMLDAGYSMAEIEEKYGTPKQFARSLKIEYFIENDEISDETVTRSTRTKNRMNLVWLVILGLFASPILIPVAIGLIGILFAAVIGFLGIIFGIYVGIIGVLAGGLIAFINGVILLWQSVATGVFYIGAGLLLTGAVIFFAPIVWRITHWLFEVLVTFIKWVGNRYLSKNNVKGAR